MRIDPDTCRDADLLAAEVRRLRAVNTIDQSAYGGDIVQRLRNWRGLHLAHGGKLFEQAADEIERLRLTDAERQAIKEAADAYEQNNDDPDCERIADTLHGLLERTQ